MASFNKVIIVGNVTRDIELRYTSGKTAVADIGIAINERKKVNNDWVDDTTFVDVTLWGRTAEVASEYLNKGSTVLIEGRLQLDTWEKDGQKRSKLKVVGERLQLLDKKSDGGQQKQMETNQGKPESHSGSLTGGADDDLPF